MKKYVEKWTGLRREGGDRQWSGVEEQEADSRADRHAV